MTTAAAAALPPTSHGAVEEHSSNPAARTGSDSGLMTKKVFTGLAALLLLAIVAQFFLAASGAFNSAPTEEAFQPHRMLGYSILILAVVVTIVGAVARMPRRIVGMAGLTVVLVLVQMVIAEVAKAVGDGSSVGHLIFGLHAVNGLLTMGAAETAMQRARKLTAKPSEPSPVAS